MRAPLHFVQQAKNRVLLEQLRAGLWRKEETFSFAYPAFTPRRVIRVYGDMPGYFKAIFSRPADAGTEVL